MKRPTAWTAAWLVWLVVFLLIEVPAAVSHTKLDTLSENVWKWFGVKTGKDYIWPPRRRAIMRRVLLAAFMLTLTSHFVFGWPGGLGVIVTGIPVAVVIAYAVVKE